MGSHSVRDLVGSPIIDYIYLRFDKVKKAFMLAKDSGITRVEILFYRHSNREKLTKHFLHTHMNYLKALLSNEII